MLCKPRSIDDAYHRLKGSIHGPTEAPRRRDILTLRAKLVGLDIVVPRVATWENLRQIALALPETNERDSRGACQWRVKDKLFVWERPLRTKEVEELGGAAPNGPILAARVEHLSAKEALLADDSGIYFTTSHFDDYPAILVRLDRIELDELREVVIEAWLTRAPRTLAKAYLGTLS
jgi:hypothetical protein